VHHLREGPGCGRGWRASYDDFGLQVPRQLYEFPGFPCPEEHDADPFPSGPEVQRYIQSYAEAHGLVGLIRFGAPVRGLEPLAHKRGWAVRSGGAGGPALEEFDYCVVCTVMCSGHPHLPRHRGAESIRGEALHSCTLLDKEQVKGQAGGGGGGWQVRRGQRGLGGEERLLHDPVLP